MPAIFYGDSPALALRDGLAPPTSVAGECVLANVVAAGTKVTVYARACPGNLGEVSPWFRAHTAAPPGHAPALWWAVLFQGFDTDPVANTATVTCPCGGTSLA